MKNKTAKIILRCFCALLIMLILLCAAGYLVFRKEISAAMSVTRLEDGLYSMEYTGDYGFDAFLEQGGADSDSAVADYLLSYLSHGLYRADADIKPHEAGCSAICVTTADGRVLFGRNFDWEECSAIIVHTKPDSGYQSISTSCLDFLGFGESYEPDASVMNRVQAIAAIYVPLDGMNEKGLMVADLMAGDDEQTRQATGKTALTTTTMIRLLLDRAANVDEALEIMGQYDMNSSMGSAHHLFIADAGGKSVVVEYVNGEMYITDTVVVTNHYLTDCGKTGTGSQQSHERYDLLSAYNAPEDERGVLEMLEAAAQKSFPKTEGSYEKTMWSIAYNPGALCANFCFNENYAHDYGLILLEKGSFVKR